MRVLAFAWLAACGRIDFAPVGDAGPDAGPAPGVSLVQQRGATAFNMPTLSLVLPSAPRLGDVLVLCGASFDVNLSGVSGGGGAWTMAVRDGTTDNIEIWYAVVTTAGSTTVVVDGTGTVRSLWGHVSEWSGVATTTPLDATRTAAGTTTADAALVVDVTGPGRELAFACLVDSTGSSFTDPTPGPWTALDGVGDGNISQGEWFQPAAPPGSPTIAISHTGTYWDVATATFR